MQNWLRRLKPRRHWLVVLITGLVLIGQPLGTAMAGGGHALHALGDCQSVSVADDAAAAMPDCCDSGMMAASGGHASTVCKVACAIGCVPSTVATAVSPAGRADMPTLCEPESAAGPGIKPHPIDFLTPPPRA